MSTLASRQNTQLSSTALDNSSMPAVEKKPFFIEVLSEKINSLSQSGICGCWTNREGRVGIWNGEGFPNEKDLETPKFKFLYDLRNEIPASLTSLRLNQTEVAPVLDLIDHYANNLPAHGFDKAFINDVLKNIQSLATPSSSAK